MSEKNCGTCRHKGEEMVGYGASAGKRIYCTHACNRGMTVSNLGGTDCPCHEPTERKEPNGHAD